MTLETFNSIVPLLAVLLTAAFSGYLVPLITQGWQDHQKELELKTPLVQEINDAVLQFVLVMQFAERNASITEESLTRRSRRWEVQRAVCGKAQGVLCGDRYPKGLRSVFRLVN